MSEDLLPNSKTLESIQIPVHNSKIQQNLSIHGHFQNTEVQNPSFMQILQPASIFSQYRKTLKIDDYLKIKVKEKSKEHLEDIQQKKQAFIRYINSTQQQQLPSNSHQSIKKYQFCQNTFGKKCKEQMVFFVRIAPSKSTRCNILMLNLRGEVIKYYADILKQKKNGKILKFSKQNTNAVLVIFDKTPIKETLTLINKIQFLYYLLTKQQINERIIESLKEKISVNQKIILQESPNGIILLTNKMVDFQRVGILDKILAKISILEDEQNQFLTAHRGIKHGNECNVPFDAMLINIWKQYKLQGQFLIGKVFQLFDEKEVNIKQEIIQQHSEEHIPKRMKSCKRCSFCHTFKRPKRPNLTFWICAYCTLHHQRPIYLCKRCFPIYHQNPNLLVFNKHHKTASIIKKRICHNKKILESIGKSQQKKEKLQDDPHEQTLLQLDQAVGQYFKEIDLLMANGALLSAESSLLHLLNITIMKNQQFLEKIKQQSQPKEMDQQN